MKNTTHTQTIRATIASSGSESISRSVVEAVADAEDVSAVELSPPLYDAIDPDALEQFVDSVAGPTAEDVSVTFEYAGYEVTVTGDGAVDLDAA